MHRGVGAARLLRVTGGAYAGRWILRLSTFGGMSGMRKTSGAVAMLSALDTSQWRYLTQLSHMTLLHAGQASRTLHRFLAAGLVERMIEDEREARTFERNVYARGPRHYYRLTPAGVALRDRWGAAPG